LSCLLGGSDSLIAAPLRPPPRLFTISFNEVF
jgi:hypothetical protein